MYISSFKNKLFLFFSGMIIIQTLVMGFIYYSSAAASVTGKLYDSYASTAESIGSSLDANMGRVEWCLNSILASTSLQAFVKETDFGKPGGDTYEALGKANRLIDNILYNEKDIVSALIVPLKIGQVYSLINRSYIDINDPGDQDGYLKFQETIDLNGKINWIGLINMREQDTDKKYFGVSRLLRDITTQVATQDPLAVFYIFYSDAILSGCYAGRELEPGSSLLILDENNNIITGTGSLLHSVSLLNPSFLKHLNNIQGTIFEQKVEGRKMRVAYYSLKNRPWRVIYIIPDTNLSLQVMYIVLSTLLLCILMLVGFIAVSYIFSYHMTHPLRRLVEGIKELENGNFEVVVKRNSEDEVGSIIEGFNRMVVKIKGLFNQVIEEEKQKREYEIRTLQYQINPHFIYNTLNSVRLMALLNNQQSIAEVLDRLIRFFRNVIGRKDSMILIEEEIENIKLYIYIQNVRYNGNIEALYDISETACGCKVPNFILQPIVENAIFHGIEPKKTGTIKIGALCHNGILSIRISDNGVGMTEEQIDTLLKQSNGITSEGHIGLFNVNKRIKLHFGEEYGVQLESVPGCGTTITVRIPKC